jgi:hypothetical protein
VRSAEYTETTEARRGRMGEREETRYVGFELKKKLHKKLQHRLIDEELTIQGLMEILIIKYLESELPPTKKANKISGK